MKAQEYREMSSEELNDKLEELQRQVYDLRCQAVTEKVENYKAAKNVKKEIARVKTVLRQSQV